MSTRLDSATGRRPFAFFGPAPGRRSFLRLVTGGALSVVAVGARGLIDAPSASAQSDSCCGIAASKINIWCPNYCTEKSEEMLDTDFSWTRNPPRMICWTCNSGQCRCCECAYWSWFFGWPPNCWWVAGTECGYMEGCCS